MLCSILFNRVNPKLLLFEGAFEGLFLIFSYNIFVCSLLVAINTLFFFNLMLDTKIHPKAK